MANGTRCLTSGAIFHTGIFPNSVSVKVDLPFPLDVDAEEAAILETLIHNQLELVLRPYFDQHARENTITTKNDHEHNDLAHAAPQCRHEVFDSPVRWTPARHSQR
jgi:hypothetical protein